MNPPSHDLREIASGPPKPWTSDCERYPENYATTVIHHEAGRNPSGNNKRKLPDCGVIYQRLENSHIVLKQTSDSPTPTANMIESLFQSTTVPLLEQVAKFAERRQEVLAGNMANINTDDYRMRDLPVEQFQTAMKQAIEQSKKQAAGGEGTDQMFVSPGAIGISGGGSFQSFFTEELFAAVEADPQNLTFQDGNNRSMEAEVMEMTKNAMMQSMAIQFINSQMALLEHVISERA